MNKKIMLSLITIAGVGIIGATTYLITKNKKKHQEPVVDDKESTEENDIIDVVVEDIFDIEEDDDSIIEDYFKFLVENNISEPEASSVVETIREIKKNLPEKFLDVREEMEEIMKNEFDSEKSFIFDKKNFNQFYLSIDPAELFVSNGFKILAMGPDCQSDMYDLADALISLIENKPDEASTVMHDIYHLFNSLNIECVNAETYEAYFKEYVDKYVKIDGSINCTEGDTIRIMGINAHVTAYDDDHNCIGIFDTDDGSKMNDENKNNEGESADEH